MSVPWSVVPNGWRHEGPCPASSSEYAVGSWKASQGAMIATVTVGPGRMSPPRDFGFASRRRIHCGTRTRRRPAAGSGTGTTSTAGGAVGSADSSAIGWIPDTSGAPNARVEDEVEHVHDEVGQDHAERKHEQQRL